MWFSSAGWSVGCRWRSCTLMHVLMGRGECVHRYICSWVLGPVYTHTWGYAWMKSHLDNETCYSWLFALFVDPLILGILLFDGSILYIWALGSLVLSSQLFLFSILGLNSICSFLHAFFWIGIVLSHVLYVYMKLICYACLLVYVFMCSYMYVHVTCVKETSLWLFSLLHARTI